MTGGVPPFELPIEVALARPITRLPASAEGLSAQAKVDGWRAILLTGPEPRVFSRHGKDLTKAFADIAEAARFLPPSVLDGELVAVLPTGELSFGLLQTRSGKGPKAGAGFAAQFAAFDALSAGDTDLRDRPHLERHARLLGLLEGAPPGVQPLPITGDLDEARRWFGALGGGVEGCVLKPTGSRYRPGYASNWLKFRVHHSVDAVVVGITPGSTPAGQAAVLAQPNTRGQLRPVGVSLPLGQTMRAELAPLLRPVGGELVELPGTLGGLPGAPQVSYLPVHPDVVVEIEVDQKLEFGRYRHRPRVLRMRGDLTADQVTPPRTAL
ncbi:ATP-dependent DNA ligase [Kitasatospora sp. GAS1066B]